MLPLDRDPPDWAREGKTWPNRDLSRFVTVGGIRWHLQEAGDEAAPGILLIHGTGASTHSYRALVPLLKADFRVFACDLPGHGFTRAENPGSMTLPGMAKAVERLLDKLDFRDGIGIGHSAGAAILLQMALRDPFRFRHIVGINSALEPMRGNTLLSPLAKLLFLNPFTPRLFSWQARSGNVGRTLLDSTGSKIDAEGEACYLALFRNPAHVRGALGMMANWELEPLQSAFAGLRTPVTLVAATDDPMVAARVSRQAARAIPGCDLIEMPVGGHLLHEADPHAIAKLAGDIAKKRLQ